MQITSAQLESAAKRAAAWMAAQLTPMGNFKGKEPQQSDGAYPDTDDIGCYYKSIYFLRSAGESSAAGRCMHYILRRFQSPEGDFYNSPEVRSLGSYGPVFSHLYQNSWLMRGAVALQWIWLSGRILRFMNTQRDPNSGGYYSQVNSKTGIMDSNSTAVGAYCCLLAGEYRMARQSCDLLRKFLSNQQDDGLLWARCRPDAMPITDLSDVAAKSVRFVRVSAREPEQAYWLWGWPMNALIAMHEITEEKKYLKAATRIFDFFTTCHPHAFAFSGSGKTAWGAMKLHRLTREPRYLEKAMSQMQYILDHQHPDGYMLNEGVKDESGQSRRITCDFTADFGTWLIDVAAEMAALGL